MHNKSTAFTKTMLGCFFIVSWLAVFSTAFMNGDDVVHFSSALHGSLTPMLHQGWTPNRVIDIYGRTIFSSLFSFLFFSINSIVSIGFFAFYKLVSATFFSFFLTVVFSYFLRHIPMPENNRALRLAFALCIAMAILQVFFWRNQVHFICYQLPAFLTFVLLKMTFEARGAVLSASKLSGFVLLSYISCFSLESFTLTIFLFSFLLLAMVFKSEARFSIANMLSYVRRETYPKLLLINLFFSAVSLIVVVLFSDRSKGQASANFLGGFQFLIGSRIAPIIALLIFLVVLVLVLRRYQKTRDEATGFTGMLYFSLYLCALTLVTTYFISAKSNTDYFDLRDYPWGDLMLVGKIAFLYLIGITIAQLTLKANAQPVATLVLIVIFSRLLYFFFDHVERDALMSLQIGKIYSAVTTEHVATLNTGLALDAIPMPVRPLPSATSPQWFVEGYQTTFKKYYGVKALPVFQ